MTTQKLINYVLLLITFGLLSACGSSGGGDGAIDQEKFEQNNNNGNSTTQDKTGPQVEYPGFYRANIEENEVEGLIKKVHALNDLWIAKLKQELENVNYSSVIATASYSTGHFSFGESCEGSGSYQAKGYHENSLENTEGSRIFEPNDYFEVNFNYCQYSTDYHYYISGRHKRTVLQGYYDDYDYLSLPAKVAHIYEDVVLDWSQYNLTDFDSYNEFKEGDLSFLISDADHVTAEGESFAEKSKSLRLRSSYKIENFDLTLTRTPGRYDWLSEYELSSNNGLMLSMTRLDAKYAIRYQTPVHYRDYDSSFMSGKFVIEGLASKIEVSYFDTYVSYRFDAEGDGDYEIESSLLVNEL